MGGFPEMRAWRGWMWAVLCVAGCLQPASHRCDLGGVCPAELRCATRDGVDLCVLPTCGNGRSEGAAGLLDDTWTWTVRSGSAVTASPAPRARSGAAMAYDPVNDQVVLFGGEQLLDPSRASAGLSSETWAWRRAAWTPRTVYSGTPPPRELRDLPRRLRGVPVTGGRRHGPGWIVSRLLGATPVRVTLPPSGNVTRTSTALRVPMPK